MRSLPIFFLFCFLSPVQAQDTAPRDRVNQLVGQLDATAEDVRLAAARVTIRGRGLRLSEALEQLQRQSGNTITDLRERMGEEAANPQLDLDLNNATFFEALDRICSESKLAPNFYTGDGSIGLVTAAPPTTPPGAHPGSVAGPTYTGPFRVLLKRVTVSRDFTTGADTANAQFEIAWEPRLRPILLALKAQDVAIVDDRDHTILPSVSEESTSIPIQPENPVAEISLNMDAPDRQARRFATLKARIEFTLPAGLHEFHFPSIDKDAKLTRGQVSVALARARVEEQVWKLGVTVDSPGAGPALESYQQGLLNNRVWLVRPDGGRLDLNGPHGGGFNTLGNANGRATFEYLFVDVPGKTADYGLIYETPSRITTRPATFELHDVPLP